ncbi:hypothetical protein D9611_011135 [Ephemerocybe angulata]|uniref:DUF6699 domain-containing protein n=1 Tax=Ephemerocybe angulata TaxID=980116 RepID=A0A8H5CC67_9AGAR|nr:hypothetical protein D9611_011135 [Tulosesus angulatus]
MSNANNASAGPSTLSGAQHVGVNEIHSVVAGRDAHRNAPVFNFNGPVHMADPSFGPISGVPILRDPRGTLAPQRLGIVNGLSRLLTWLQCLRIQDPSTQGTSSAMESEGSGAEDSQMANSTPATSSKESISLSSLQDIGNRSVDWQRLRTPEVYVFRMLNIMRGLPCWQPDPQGLAEPEGVVPGDVGTYSVGDGFMKLFNIWDDEEPIRKTAARTSNTEPYAAPEGRRVIHTPVFSQGDTVTEGPSASTIFRTGTDHIERFEFGCESQTQGAILALTSPAKRERLFDHTALRQHIVDHAETIYRHANSLRRIGEDEALYIITGSIKGNSWGLAAFSNPMFPPNDTTKLEHLSRGLASQSGDESMFYAWTQKGTSDARVGSSANGAVWDQSLFLEGFKLDFSSEFRARMRQELNPPSRGSDAQGGSDLGHSSGGGTSFGGPGGFERDSSGEPPAPSGHRGHGGIEGGGSGYRGLDESKPTEGIDLAGLHIQSFPDSPRGTSCHPCDIINEALLELTGSSFALSHDDDWLSIADNVTSGNLPAIIFHKGVAYLGNAGDARLLGSVPVGPSRVKAKDDHLDDPGSENEGPTPKGTFERPLVFDISLHARSSLKRVRFASSTGSKNELLYERASASVSSWSSSQPSTPGSDLITPPPPFVSHSYQYKSVYAEASPNEITENTEEALHECLAYRATEPPMAYNLVDNPSMALFHHSSLSPPILAMPAITPELPSLTIQLPRLPSSWEVHVWPQANRRFVTVGDLLIQVYEQLRWPVPQQDYHRLRSDADRKEEVAAYERRYKTLSNPEAYQSEKEGGMIRVDFLGRKTLFLGLEKGKKSGVWILNTG